MVHISADGDDTTTARPGVNEAGVQTPVSRSSSRQGDVRIMDATLYMTWHATCPRPALSPINPMHCTPDDDPPAWKTARAVTSATQDESSPVGHSATVSVAQYSALPALVVCPFPSGRR